MNIQVLIAEDDPKIINLIRIYLEREGMSVICAQNGREAVRLLNNSIPICLFLTL